MSLQRWHARRCSQMSIWFPPNRKQAETSGGHSHPDPGSSPTVMPHLSSESCWARLPAGSRQGLVWRYTSLPRGPLCVLQAAVAQDKGRTTDSDCHPVPAGPPNYFVLTSLELPQGWPCFLLPLPSWARLLAVPHTHQPSKKKLKFLKRIY